MAPAPYAIHTLAESQSGPIFGWSPGKPALGVRSQSARREARLVSVPVTYVVARPGTPTQWAAALWTPWRCPQRR